MNKSKITALAMMDAMMTFAKTNEPSRRKFKPTSKKSADKKFKGFLKRNVGF